MSLEKPNQAEKISPRIFSPEEVQQNWSEGILNSNYPENIMPIRYIGDQLQRQAAVQDLLKRVSPNSSLLGGGSGQGYMEEALALSGFSVAGLEVDPNMLHKAIQRQADFIRSKTKSSNQISEIQYILGDLLDIPFGDFSFDAAYECGVAIFNSPPKLAKIMAEYARVLKPNGILSLSTYHEYLVSGQSPLVICDRDSPRSTAKVSDLILTGTESVQTKLGLFTSTKADEYYYHAIVSPDEIRKQPPFPIYIHPTKTILAFAEMAGLELIEMTDLYIKKEHLDISQNWTGGTVDYPYFKRYIFRKPE